MMSALISDIIAVDDEDDIVIAVGPMKLKHCCVML